MVAGNNSQCQIWRMDNADDDEVGGSIITGSVIYNYVNIRFQSQPTEQIFLQQGLETPRVYTAIIVPGYLDIRERDLVEITDPKDHIYYGEKFRVIGVRYSSHNRRDPRNYIMLDMYRSVRAHSYQ